MSPTLSTVALLACPVGMGLMMLLMMRGGGKHAPDSGSAGDAHEIAALRSEIAKLKGVGAPANAGRPE
ncbi:MULTISPECIES: hypothetical protein [Nocardia]|nr:MULTISPECIES: hypothetical protein [Nocardia]MCC3316773.1 hypothetical protein [Nocardia africana]